jgi:hypothetical protein
MVSRARWGAAAHLRPRTHAFRRLVSGTTAVVLAGVLTFIGLPTAFADDAASQTGQDVSVAPAGQDKAGKPDDAG